MEGVLSSREARGDRGRPPEAPLSTRGSFNTLICSGTRPRSKYVLPLPASASSALMPAPTLRGPSGIVSLPVFLASLARSRRRRQVVNRLSGLAPPSPFKQLPALRLGLELLAPVLSLLPSSASSKLIQSLRSQAHDCPLSSFRTTKKQNPLPYSRSSSLSQLSFHLRFDSDNCYYDSLPLSSFLTNPPSSSFSRSTHGLGPRTHYHTRPSSAAASSQL